MHHLHPPVMMLRRDLYSRRFRSRRMEQDENSPNGGDSPLSSSPSPLYAKRILDAHREGSDSSTRVKLTGAEMSKIYRAYYGRLKISYWRPEDNERVCNDAMELLDQIVIFRGCEPSVIISYVALVREVYLHACTNLREKDISVQERKTKMLEQWKQIEKHFAKIKYVMVDCWPVGNESDLMAAYVSIALLYSLYKEVCDESIIRQCYEAAERARQCGRGSLSESQFNEVQQYCDTIENIFFLRRQRSSLSSGRSEYVNNDSVGEEDAQAVGDNDKDGDYLLQPADQQQLTVDANSHNPNAGIHSDSRSILGRIKDGPALLAEYGRLTIAGKIPIDEKVSQKRLRPSDFEIKNAQKRLKQQKSADSPTIFTELEAALTARSNNANGNVEFPRPSDLKLNRNLKNPKSDLGTKISDNSALSSGSADLQFDTSDSRHSGSIAKQDSINSVLTTSDYNKTPSDSSYKSSASCPPTVHADDTMTTVVNIGDTPDTQPSTSSQIADADFLASIVQNEDSEAPPEYNGEDSKTNFVPPKLESYVNELVEEIFHTVTEISEKISGKRSRRNSETIQKIDTVQSSVLTSSNGSVPNQGSVIMLNDENQGARGGQEGINKNISIRAKRILKENIDQQIENIIVGSVTEMTAVNISTNPDVGAIAGQKDSNSCKAKSKMVVIEGYAEMELNNDTIPESLYDLHQTSLDQNLVDSDLDALAKSHIRSTSTAMVPETITTMVLSATTSPNCGSQKDEKKSETDSLIDRLEELSKETEKVQKLFSDNGEVQTYVVMEHRDEGSKITGTEENEKFNKVLETLQKLEKHEEQHQSVTLETFRNIQFVDDESEITDSSVVTKPILAAANVLDKQEKMEEGTHQDPKLQKLTDAQGKYIVTESSCLEAVPEVPMGTVINVTDKNASDARGTTSETVLPTATAQRFPATVETSHQQKPYWLTEEKVVLAPTVDPHYDSRNLEDAPMQKLHYTTDLPFAAITSSVIKNLLVTLDKFDARQAKSQSNPPPSGGALFENYANFEPASCNLNRVPEVDVQPLPMKPSVPEYRPQFQAVRVNRSAVPDQKDCQKYLAESTKMPQSITGTIGNDQEFSGHFESLKPKIVESASDNIIQTEPYKRTLQQQQYRISATSQTIPSASLHSQTTITPPRIGPKPVITELEISKSITAKHKSGTEESSKPKLKSILKKTFAKTESLFTKGDSKHHQYETTPPSMPAEAPAVQQRGFHRPLGKDINERKSDHPKPPLPPRPDHLSKMRKELGQQSPQIHPNTSEVNVTHSDLKRKIPDFSVSETCQASTSKQIEVLGVPEPVVVLKRLPELSKQPLECKMSEETSTCLDEKRPKRGKSSSRTSAIWNLANKLSPHKRDNAEHWGNVQKSTASSDALKNSEEVIQVPHFDAKAEFERRLSGKKKRHGEMPVIVKNANLRHGSEGSSGGFDEGSLITSTSKMSSSEKPNFNFIIKKDDDDNIDNCSNNPKNVGVFGNLQKGLHFTDISDSITC